MEKEAAHSLGGCTLKYWLAMAQHTSSVFLLQPEWTPLPFVFVLRGFWVVLGHGLGG
jgi:hypothetical protein